MKDELAKQPMLGSRRTFSSGTRSPSFLHAKVSFATMARFCGFQKLMNSGILLSERS